MDRNLLILDLDETLLHAAESPRYGEPDFCVAHYHVYLRPHLEEFIRTCRQFYDLAVWTSAGEDYAAVMASRIIPSDTSLRFIWANTRCTSRLDPETLEQIPIKDFKKLKRAGYDLERVLVIDDSPEKHVRNYGNLIRVSPFLGDRTDRELLLLTDYLLAIRGETRLRSLEKRNWRMIASRKAE